MPDNKQEPFEFMGAELSPEEYAKERAAEMHRDATEAQELLNHPKIQAFLKSEKEKSLRAYKLLPMEASHEKYMALKIYFNVLDTFESNLKAFILKYEHELIKQERQNN